MKKSFLKKELVPENVSIDDFLLSDLILSDKELEVVFKKRSGIRAEQFRLKMILTEEFSVEVSYTEENGVETSINAVPELKNELNMLRLQELGKKIAEKTNDLYLKKQKLETIFLEEKDIFEEKLVLNSCRRSREYSLPLWQR